METEAPLWLWFLLPVLFVTFGGALWLGVTTLLGALSGWSALQRRYPDRPETPVLELRGQTGMMGVGVSYNHCLKLDVCPGGLRVDVTRLLAPRRKAFFVPWAEIAAAERQVVFMPMVRLTFGQGVGNLVLRPKTFAQIAAASPLQTV